MANHRSMGWVGGLVYGSIPAVVGYFIVAHMAMGGYHMGQASKSWPTIQGKVIHSTVVSNTSPQGKTSYSANIQFTYRVDGRDYTSSRIRVELGPGAAYSSDSSSPDKTVNRYPVGKVVRVYYNAAKPSVSVLQAGVSPVTWRVIGIGGFFIFLGAWLALSGMIRTLFGIGMFGVLTFAWLRKDKPPALIDSDD